MDWSPENYSEVADITSFNVSYHDKFASKLAPWMDYVICVYLILIGILTIFLNFAVLLTAARRHRSCSPLELYVINLAVGDLLVGLLAYPVHAWMASKHVWLFGMLACKLYAFTVYFFGTSSILTLTTMSGLRYLKTCHPTADRFIGRRSVYISLVAIYFNAGIWAGGPLLGWGRYEVEPFGLSCTLDWYHPSLSYIVCAFIFVYIIPIVMMAYCYGRMTYYVHITQKHMRMVNHRKDRYLTKMTAVMCSCFLFAWTPYAVVSLCYVSHSFELVPMSLATAAPFFAKSATFYNPVVYFFAVKRFRDDVREVLFPCFIPKVDEANITMSLHIPTTCDDGSSMDVTRLKTFPKHGRLQEDGEAGENEDTSKQALIAKTAESLH